MKDYLALHEVNPNFKKLSEKQIMVHCSKSSRSNIFCDEFSALTLRMYFLAIIKSFMVASVIAALTSHALYATSGLV